MSRADGPWTPRFGLAARVISSRWFRRYFGGDLPERDIRWGGVRVGMDVYELGAGAGLYTLPLAQCIGESGRLAAGEYWPAGAALLAGRVRKAGVNNVVVHVGDGNALPARPGSLDAVCCFYSIEEIPGCANVALQLGEALRPGGLMILFLWRPLCRRAKRNSLIASLKKAGFREAAVWRSLQNYRIVLEKPIEDHPASQ